MTDDRQGPSTATLEGRLLAQRKAIALLLARAGPDLLEALERQGGPPAPEEDPGAVVDPAFAVAAALAEEIEALTREARRLSGER